MESRSPHGSWCLDCDGEQPTIFGSASSMIPPPFTLPYCVITSTTYCVAMECSTWKSTWNMVFVMMSPPVCVPSAPFLAFPNLCAISHYCGDAMDCSTWGPRGWDGESTCTTVCFCKFLLHDSSSIHFSFSYVCVISSTVLLRGLYGVIYLKSRIPRGSSSLW